MGEYVEVISESYVWGMDLLMILVSLGTQDRSFKRFLGAIEKQIVLGNIKEKVVVQAGATEFTSEHMEIFDLIPSNEFEKLLKECDLLLCHGGVGTIIDGLKHHKKIIAAARLSEYHEHQNDHQKQIIHEFVNQGLILELDDFDRLDQKLLEVQDFVPREYESNTPYFISILDNYIQNALKDHKGEYIRKFLYYGFYGIFAILLEILVFLVFQKASLNSFQFLFVQACYVAIYRIIVHTIFFKIVPYDFKGELVFYSLQAIPILFTFFVSFPFLSLYCVLILAIARFFLVYLFNVLFKVRDIEL